MTSDRGAALRRKWRENHGPVLVGFVLLVLVIGIALLMFRQRGIRSSAAPPRAAVSRPPERPAADAPDPPRLEP